MGKKYSIYLAILILYPLVAGIYLNWCDDFLIPNKFKNWGDIVFHYDISSYLKRHFFAWNDNNGAGLGNENIWHTKVPHAIFLYSLEKFGIPLWWINRVEIILPIAVLGWSLFYLFCSIAKGNHLFAGAFICISFSIFAPTVNDDPTSALTLACFPFVLGAVIRTLEKPKDFSPCYLVIPAGVMWIAPSPRNLYLSFIAIFLYCLYDLITNSTKTTALFKLKSTFLAFGLVIFLNLFWLYPLWNFLLSESSFTNLFDHDLAFGSRLNQYETYQAVADPLWTFRLLFNRYGIENSPWANVLFITPALTYLSVFFIKKNKHILFFVLASLFFQILAFGPHFAWSTKLHQFFSDRMFGFWIINSPYHSLLFLVIFNSILAGIVTMELLTKMGNFKLKSLYLKKLFQGVTIIFIFIYIFFFNGGNLKNFINSPGSKITPWGYKVPERFISIPPAYFELASYLKQNSNSLDRLLNFPYVTLGYASYTWLEDGHPPIPALIGELSPIPVTGVGGHPVKLLRDKWAYSMNNFIFHNFINSRYQVTFQDAIQMGFRYILDHHDYIRVPLAFSPAIGVYRPALGLSDLYEKVIDNSYFILWKSKDKNPYLVDLVLENEDNNYKIATVLSRHHFQNPKDAPSGDFQVTRLEKINPTRFEMTVTGMLSPVWINTKFPFHPSWEARFIPSRPKVKGFSSLITSRWADFFSADESKRIENIGSDLKEFSAFRFEPTQDQLSSGGSFKVILEFTKQKTQNLTYIISGLTLFLVIFFFMHRGIDSLFRVNISSKNRTPLNPAAYSD